MRERKLERGHCSSGFSYHPRPQSPTKDRAQARCATSRAPHLSLMLSCHPTPHPDRPHEPTQRLGRHMPNFAKLTGGGTLTSRRARRSLWSLRSWRSCRAWRSRWLRRRRRARRRRPVRRCCRARRSRRAHIWFMKLSVTMVMVHHGSLKSPVDPPMVHHGSPKSQISGFMDQTGS